jgi:hypothetical protein
MRWYNGSDHMLSYEMTRISQYKNAKLGYHSNEDFRTAYFLWSEAPALTRQRLWEEYCDIRDGYALGTNTALREQHKQQARLYNEPRYISRT